MASKPTVTLTLAGDEKKIVDSMANTTAAGDKMVSGIEQDSAKLSSAFDKVGSASKAMGDKVSSSKDDFDNVGRSTEDFADKADGAESKAIGFTDSLSGAQGIMQGLSDQSLSTGDRLAVLGQGVADLAGGMANLLIPMVGGLSSKLAATAAGQWALTTAQSAWNVVTSASAVAMRLLNAAFVASPIGWIVLAIGGLVTAFVLLWNKSAAFRDFFIGMWDKIKATVGAVASWIKGTFDGVVGFFANLPGRIGSALGALGGIAKNLFKGAVNGIVDGLNWFLDHSINWLINRVNDISGIIGIPAIPTIPHIPRMHSGGVVPGLPGQEQLMVLQGGERVSTSGQGGSGTVTFAGDLSDVLAQLIMMLIRTGQIRIEV